MKNNRYDGPDYDPQLDQIRLSGQTEGVFNLMKDKKWRTLQEIELELGYPQASISAQLRHLRKYRFGSHEINKQRRGVRENGLFEYQLIPNIIIKQGELNFQ